MNKIKFSQLNATDGIHCKTVEEAIELFKFFIKKDRRWSVGKTYSLNDLRYDNYYNNTLYSLDGFFGDVRININGRTIIAFENIDFEEFPVNWYLPLTDMSDTVLKELNKWRIQQPNCNCKNANLYDSQILLSSHAYDDTYYYSATSSTFLGNTDYKDYEEITLEEFYTNILKKEKMNTNLEQALLDKAKRLYPVGTKFRSPENNSIYTFEGFNTKNTYWTTETQIIVNVKETSYYGAYLFYKGVWADIIEEFVLPEEWCIKITNENRAIVNEWKQQRRPNSEAAGTRGGTYVTYEGYNDDEVRHSEISTEQFIKYVLKKETMENFKLNFEQAQSIMNIACDAWKNKLSELWGKTLLRNGNVDITQDFYNEMIKASDSSQKEVINNIMGEHFRSKEINLRDNRTFNNLALFLPDGDVDTSLIAVRNGELTNKFYLNRRYNWEIKNNELICTRK